MLRCISKLKTGPGYLPIILLGAGLISDCAHFNIIFFQVRGCG